MHVAWVRQVCGRLESDFRYSTEVVYNNFPWPQSPSDKQKQVVRNAAQGVLDARDAQPGQTLADLYDAHVMPAALRKAHAILDKAVDTCYGQRPFDTDLSRVKYLFERYAEIISEGQLTFDLAKSGKPKRRKKSS